MSQNGQTQFKSVYDHFGTLLCIAGINYLFQPNLYNSVH